MIESSNFKQVSSEFKTSNLKSIILLWAFAESGIGGVLHALRLPFTGVFVGGLAVICIVLIAYYNRSRPSAILEALSIVLIVKLTISPHSPWQAYVAVIFQGYIGWLIFKNLNHFKLKVFFFSLLCLLESAIQKVLLAVLIFGVDFLKAIDQAAKTVMEAVGLSMNASVVWFVFVGYILLHLFVGLILGFWIPRIPLQLLEFKKKMSRSSISYDKPTELEKKPYRMFWIGLIFIVIVLWSIKFLMPDFKIFLLIWFFVRSIVISMGLIFIIGPLLKKWIRSKFSKQVHDVRMLNEIINEIPVFSNKAISMLKWVNKEYKGLTKMKYYILGLITVALDT